MDWRKSSHSGANGGSCVEVTGTARVVLVRDTKDRDGATLAFSAEAWRASSGAAGVSPRSGSAPGGG
jgi:hypothetical protein